MTPILDIWFELLKKGEAVVLLGPPEGPAKMKVREIDKDGGSITFVTPDGRYQKIFPASALALASFEQEGMRVVLAG